MERSIISRAWRRVMLKMLQAERPLQVQAIHKAAYEFYRSDATRPAGRMEPKLPSITGSGTEEQEVRRMWYPDAGESMLSSVDELPPSSQLLVYVLTLKEPPAAVRELATQDQWERLVEARARQALQYGDYELVRKLLSERDTRCEASALYAIAALVAMHRRRSSGGRGSSCEGASIQRRRSTASDRLAELWRLRGELFEQHRDFANATAALAEAQGLAMRMGRRRSRCRSARSVRACMKRRERLHQGPAGMEEIVKACGDSDFASVRLQLRGLFRNCGPIFGGAAGKGAAGLQTTVHSANAR